MNHPIYHMLAPQQSYTYLPVVGGPPSVSRPPNNSQTQGHYRTDGQGEYDHTLSRKQLRT